MAWSGVGPGKKWVKWNDGWRECVDDAKENVAILRKAKSTRILDHDTNDGKNRNIVGTEIVVDSEERMWIRVSPKLTRQHAGYDCLGDFLQKLHLTKSAEKLGPFNYMLSFMELVIKSKLPGLSGRAKRFLFRVVRDMVDRVLHTSEYIAEMKELLRVFRQEVKNVEGSFFPKRVRMKDMQCIEGWIDELDHHQVPRRQDQGRSLIDMPLEVLERILSFVDKYQDIQSVSNVHEGLEYLCHEDKQWKIRCYNHFSQAHIEKSREFLLESRSQEESYEASWRDIYLFAMKKYVKRQPEYQCLFHCQRCGLMFWNGYGHPCVPESSERYEPVPPQKLLYYFS